MRKIFLLLFVSLAVLALAVAFNLSERDQLALIEKRQQREKVSGVSAKQSELVEDPEAKAAAIASSYVEKMDFYLDRQGKNLTVIKIVPLVDDSSWVVYLRLETVPISGSELLEMAEVRITLENWQIKDALYAKEAIAVLSAEECQEKGARLANLAKGENCKPEEANIGEVLGEEGEFVCCLSME